MKSGQTVWTNANGYSLKNRKGILRARKWDISVDGRRVGMYATNIVQVMTQVTGRTGNDTGNRWTTTICCCGCCQHTHPSSSPFTTATDSTFTSTVISTSWKTRTTFNVTTVRVPTLLLTKKSRNFPGLPWKIFQDLFGSRECLNIKKKWHLLAIFRV